LATIFSYNLVAANHTGIADTVYSTPLSLYCDPYVSGTCSANVYLLRIFDPLNDSPGNGNVITIFNAVGRGMAFDGTNLWYTALIAQTERNNLHNLCHSCLDSLPSTWYSQSFLWRLRKYRG
jgi:hypothetical protein